MIFNPAFEFQQKLFRITVAYHRCTITIWSELRRLANRIFCIVCFNENGRSIFYWNGQLNRKNQKIDIII